MDPREQIKAKLDIVQLISEHIPLKQTGRNFKALCPFHGEKTPSFVVSPERQIWHCFGCGKGGDVFTFLMEFENMEFLEALRTLAKRTGVKLTTFAPSKEEAQKERLFAINHLAAEFYHYILTSHKAGDGAFDYLRKRGVNRKTIDTFMLGFAPEKWDLLLDYLTKKKGYDFKEVEDTGLIISRQPPKANLPAGGSSVVSHQSDRNFYDRFRNRIMFTLRDHRGNVVGFAGRVLDADIKEAKYVNTPETQLYHKGELFYGLDIAKEAVKKENQAIIVEGEFDMIQSFQAGVANVVALKGTALTPMQTKLIRRFTPNIALAFDVDVAGDAAARRGIQTADSEGLNIKVVRVVDAKDPDEAIRKNPIIWKKAIKKAVSVYDFLIDSALSRFDKKTPDGKKTITDEVLPTISAISNEIVKAHFIKRLASEVDVSEEVILKQMGKNEKLATTPIAGHIVPAKPTKPTREELLEEYFLALLLQKTSKSLFEALAPKITLDLLHNPVLRRIVEKLLSFYEAEKEFSIAAFVLSIPKELLPTVDRVYLFDTDSVKPENVTAELEHVVAELQVLHLRRQMEDITGQLRNFEERGDEDAATALEKKFSTLSSQLHKLTAPETKPQ